MGAPRLSILMSVYNAGPYVAASVASILGQTFTDFEFVVVDDGSTDQSWEILADYAQRDARMVLVRNQPNVGVVRALNRGLERTRGAIIARQDADDISHPERLQRQVDFLDRHPDYGLVAAVPQPISADGAPLSFSGWDATQNNDIQAKLPDYMCLCGPTVMIRRECFEAAGFQFSEGLDASEDYDLCLRIAEVTRLASLPGALYLYRQHPESASSRRAQKQMLNKAIALERAVARRHPSQPPPSLVALVARDYLHAAIIGFARDDLAMARQTLARSLAVSPHLLNRAEPLERLVRSYTPQASTDAALAYTCSIFDQLLPRTRRLARLKSRLLSYLHMSAVFSGALSPAERRSHLLLGIRQHPKWLLNPGVLSILLKSMAPGRPSAGSDRLV